METSVTVEKRTRVCRWLVEREPVLRGTVPAAENNVFEKDQLSGLLWNSLILVTSAPENGRPELGRGPGRQLPPGRVRLLAAG